MVKSLKELDQERIILNCVKVVLHIIECKKEGWMHTNSPSGWIIFFIFWEEEGC